MSAATTSFDLRELDAVLATSLRDTERTAPERLLLTLHPSAEPVLRAVAARAGGGLAVWVEDGQLLAEITVPADRVEVLEDLAVRAETAGHRTLRRRLGLAVPEPVARRWAPAA